MTNMDSKAKEMILGFLGGRSDDHTVEQTARFMARTLRIGTITECRAFVREALTA
jgi:hypothetical protein